MEIFAALCVPLGVLGLFLLAVASSAIKIVPEFERGVIFRLGRVVGAKGPGLFFVIPIVDRLIRVDLRVETLDLPSQEAITKDNVTVKVNAVVLLKVHDPVNAVIQVVDYRRTIYQIAQTTLRAVLGQSDLDEILANRDDINNRLQQILDLETEPWGIKVTAVEVKDVELPQSMQRAMARQAEAERERRAKVIHAAGEYAAAEQLAQAADLMAKSEGALQLRYLQTLTEISTEKHSTLMTFLPPQDYLMKLGEGIGKAIAAGSAANGNSQQGS